MYPPRFRLIFSSLSPQRRLVSSTSSRLSASQSTGKDKDPSVSHSQVTEADQRDPQDTQSRAARAKFDARTGSSETSTPFDAAVPGKGLGKERGFKPPRDASGNWEGLGFAEQVGSASASDGAGRGQGQGDGGWERTEKGGDGARMVGGSEEGKASSGVIPSLQQAFGMGTKVREVRQNRGGGRGVTGRGTILPSSSLGPRELHTSAALRSDADEVQGGIPTAEENDTRRSAQAPSVQGGHGREES